MEYLKADLSRKKHIVSFLMSISDEFPIPLNKKVSINDYVEKVFEKGNIIIAEENNDIAGLNMFYANDSAKKQAWISLICVAEKYRRNKVGTALLQISENISLENGMDYLFLHVHKDNVGAIKTYERFGFVYSDSVPANAEYNVTLQKKISRDVL